MPRRTLTDPLEIVTCHLVAFAKLPKPRLKALRAKKRARPRVKEMRVMHLEGTSGRVAVFERGSLLPGTRLKGPAVIEEPTATTVVNPGDRLQVDEYGNLLLQIRA